ncbi:hypothetical protein [Desulfosporosinus lacus]|uniref:hypothetical protein n=1 Tax=Desulfosporosinus lacus TaxID=329936 RepID=UPI0011608D2E|nr:hypothetical protein [Desulfosporosinus lacus]
MPTTQSKLTVKALGLGERGSSFGDSIILKNPPTAIISLETIVPDEPAVCYAVHGAHPALGTSCAVV